MGGRPLAQRLVFPPPSDREDLGGKPADCSSRTFTRSFFAFGANKQITGSAPRTSRSRFRHAAKKIPASFWWFVGAIPTSGLAIEYASRGSFKAVKPIETGLGGGKWKFPRIGRAAFFEVSERAHPPLNHKLSTDLSTIRS